MTMKKMISLALAICMALALAVPAGAAMPDNKTAEEVYQEYQEVADCVKEESGVDISICPLSEMDKDHMKSVEEVKKDICELRDTILAISNFDGVSDEMGNQMRRVSHSNPSAKGPGDKYVGLNKTPERSAGAPLTSFIFGFNAHFYVSGTENNYWLKVGPDQIKVSMERIPNGYSCTTNGSPIVTTQTTGTQVNKKVTQNIKFYKDGTCFATAPVYVVFSLNTQAGVITGRAH